LILSTTVRQKRKGGTARLVAVLVTLCGCGSSGSSGNTQSTAPTTPPAGDTLFVPPSGVSISELFANDDETIWVLADDGENVSLDPLGATTGVFTTPIAGALPPVNPSDVPVAVALAAGNAFYSTQDALHEVSLETGVDTVLGTPGCSPAYADATSVFCASGGVVRAFSVAPPVPTVFAPDGGLAGQPTPGDASIVGGAGEEAGPTAGTMATEGGTPVSGMTVVDVSPDMIADVFADATTVYVISRPSGSLYASRLSSVPRTGGSAVVIADATAEERDFAFTPGQSDPSTIYLSIAAGIARFSKSDSSIDIVFENGSPLTSLCFGSAYVHGAYFYFGCSTTVSRALLVGGMPTVVAGVDGYIVVTDQGIYVATVEVINSMVAFPVRRVALPP
jgi:hypothetical protein